MIAKEGALKKNLGRLAVSLAGLSTVAAHYLIHEQTKHGVRETVEAVVGEQVEELREQIAGQKVEQIKGYARREDMEKLSRRIEDLGDTLSDLAQRNAELEGYLRGRDRQQHDRTEVFWRRALTKKRR